NALKDSSLLADGKAKEFYIQISDIIRRYIEGRYFIVALELTTFEVIEKLKYSDVTPEIVQLIQEFLEFCDLVKFAKYQPADEENSDMIDKAFEVVERSKLIYDQPQEALKETAEIEQQEPVERAQILVDNLEEPK
ncbi:MAG: hypothetical protein ACE5HI_15930, partial [bacterium]